MKRIIWSFLILLSSFLFVFFAFKTFIDIRAYNKLDRKSKATVASWEINEHGDKYIVSAVYNYNVDDKTFEGKTFFNKANFLNYYSAFEALAKFAKNDWTVWYNSRNFEESSLEKRLAIKNLLYTSISLSVLVYFLVLRRVLKKYI